MRKILLILSLLVSHQQLNAVAVPPAPWPKLPSKKESPRAETPFIPWFTGPLIAPVGEAVPFGHFEIQPYVFATVNTGAYNQNWSSVGTPNFFSLSPQCFCYFGLTPWCDISIVPAFFYNETKGQESFGFGDFLARLDFQLYPADTDFWFPGILFAIQEIFPTGKFERLDPKKLYTDKRGAGAFATSFNLVFYKVYSLGNRHALSFTASAEYAIAPSIDVAGFNAYGGGFGTNGTVLPGNVFEGIVSFEFNFNQRWNIALDNVWTHTDATSFYGDAGVNVFGDEANNSKHSSEQFSFAPAIEYSWSENLGIIAGCWFTALGRNSTEFRSGVVNLTYTY